MRTSPTIQYTPVSRFNAHLSHSCGTYLLLYPNNITNNTLKRQRRLLLLLLFLKTPHRQSRDTGRNTQPRKTFRKPLMLLLLLMRKPKGKH